VSPAINHDAFDAAVTASAQRIAAYADKHQIPITPAQCEDLAGIAVRFAEGFVTGVSFAGHRDNPFSE
jgi:hypothetical protein